MTNEQTSTEERLFALMKRLRQLEMDSCPVENGSISPSQMILLDQIATTPGCGVQDIADALKLTPPTVSIGVRKIEKSGLIERKPNPLDGRSVQFFLTPGGWILQKEIHDSHQQKFRFLLTGLNSDEQEHLLQLLERALRSAEFKISDSSMNRQGCKEEIL